MNRIFLATCVWVIASSAIVGSSNWPGSSFSPTTRTALVENWTKTWGANAKDAAHNLAVDQGGNVYIIGEFSGTVDFNPDPDPAKTEFHTSSNGTIDAFLAKFDANGVFQWAKTWGGSKILPNGNVGRDVANGIVIDGAGYIYVSGPYQYTVDFDPDPTIIKEYTSNGIFTNNIFLSKFSPGGALQWVKTWGPSDGGAESYSLAYDPTGFIYVAGDFSGTKTNFNPWDLAHPDWHNNHPPAPGTDVLFFDSYISKFDTSGNFQWAKTWGGEGYDDGPGVTIDGAGNIYVAGMYASKVINFDPAGGPGGANHPASDSGVVVDVFFSKFDKNGTFQWVKTWGGPGVDDAGELAIVDSANNVYITGRFGCTNCNFNPGGTADIHSSNGDLDAFITKFNSAGTYQWSRTWGGPGWDATGSLMFDDQENIYTTGFFVGLVDFNPSIGTNTIQSKGGRDAFFSKFTSNGSYLWTKTWGGSEEDMGWHLAGDANGNFYVVGSFSNAVNFDPDLGVDIHTSNGNWDAYMIKFQPIALTNTSNLPLILSWSAP